MKVKPNFNPHRPRAKLFKIADEHLLASKDSVLAASSYEGSHWLATFMTLALKARQDALNEQ